MCTLVVFVPGEPTSPLLVAANRDERLDRPASRPHRWPDERFFAPRDELAGGTWLGIHDSGLFVGVTNRAGSPRDPRLASRGELTAAALRLGGARKVHDAFERSLDPRRYNPFHLLYADRDGAFVTAFDGEAVHRQVLAPGLHVVTERSLGGDDRGRELRVRRRLGPLFAGEALPSLESLAPALAEHVPGDPIASTCVHVPELGYGTRSSLLLEVRAGKPARWLWAEGPPCTTAYEEMTVTP